MKVRSISTAVVEANFDWTIVRIEADDGTTGWGESFFAPGLTNIIDELAVLVVGEDPRNILPLIDRLYTATSGAGSTGGIVLNAISGIDAALWDLSARAAGVPLWQLLGGRFTDAVRMYADCHGGAQLMSLGPLLDIRRPAWIAETEVSAGRIGSVLFTPGAETGELDLGEVTAQARAAVALGFDALKFDIDVPGLIPTTAGSRRLPAGAVPRLEALVAAIQQGAGSGVEFALDCHWRYDLPSAVLIADGCREAGLLWLEDPLAPDDVTGLRELARTNVPLATGENLGRWTGFAPLIEQRAVSVVTPDLAKVGGLAEARLVGQTAASRGLGIAPHNIAGPVGTAFAAQVSATYPNLVALEFHGLSVPFFAELIGGQELIVGGQIPLTDRPGIGVDVDEEAVGRYAKAGTTVFGRRRTSGSADG